jgi:hypothetical protein
MQFDIGWAPEGWVRGNPLGFINGAFEGGPVAALYYKVQSPFGEIPEIGGIEYTKAQSGKVDAWLDWWYAPSEVAA